MIPSIRKKKLPLACTKNTLLAGFYISFLGALPIGVLNITAMKLSSVQGSFAAISFTLATIAVELVAVIIALRISGRFNLNNRIFKWLIPLFSIILVVVAIDGLIHANAVTTSRQPMTVAFGYSPILLGLILSALNPLHIPFWTGWSSFLISQGLLKAKPGLPWRYLMGIGLGSLLGIFPYIFMGHTFIQYFPQFGFITNIAVSLTYLGLAVLLLVRMFFNKKKGIVVEPVAVEPSPQTKGQ